MKTWHFHNIIQTDHTLKQRCKSQKEVWENSSLSFPVRNETGGRKID
jgi:hypothetical protein